MDEVHCSNQTVRKDSDVFDLSEWQRYHTHADELRVHLETIYSELRQPEQCLGGFDDSRPVNCVLRLADGGNDVNFEQDLKGLLDTGAKATPSGVIAFYALCTRYRRRKEYQLFGDLIQSYRNLYIDEDLYKIQESYYLITVYSADSQRLRDAYDIWRDISDRYKAMPAFIQIYAEIVALCEEHGVLLDDLAADNGGAVRDAIEALGIAMRIRPYPKFWSTRGRLEACQKRYQDAYRDIKEAISREDAERDDFAIRVGEYQLLLAKVEIAEYTEEKLKAVNDKVSEIDRMRNELNSSRYDTLSLLGLFSAVIALVVGAAGNLFGDTTFVEKVQILLCLGGVIIIAFSSINLLIPRHEALHRALVMGGIGLSIVVIALLLIPLLVAV